MFFICSDMDESLVGAERSRRKYKTAAGAAGALHWKGFKRDWYTLVKYPKTVTSEGQSFTLLSCWTNADGLMCYIAKRN
jgi:hypothetical protein